MEAEEKGRLIMEGKQKKMVEVAVIDGNELALRKETVRDSLVMCACTHERVPVGDCVKVVAPTGHSVAGQPYRYVQEKFAEQTPYGSDWQGVDDVVGVVTKSAHREALELEYLRKHGVTEADMRRIRLILAARFRLQDSADGSVDGEFHMPHRLNLCGIKDLLTEVSKLVDMTDPRCGTHVNVSRPDWKGYEVGVISDNASMLFSEISAYLASHEEDMREVFGRTFGYYAENSGDYNSHYCWIHLHKRQNFIEFRLPHYVEANSFMHTMQLCFDWVDVLTDYINGGIKTAEEASHKLVKIFRKYADGKAACQKASRNTLDRV